MDLAQYFIQTEMLGYALTLQLSPIFWFTCRVLLTEEVNQLLHLVELTWITLQGVNLMLILVEV
jgi:hypothetical protein